jgi:hypothetical protein
MSSPLPDAERINIYILQSKFSLVSGMFVTSEFVRLANYSIAGTPPKMNPMLRLSLASKRLLRCSLYVSGSSAMIVDEFSSCFSLIQESA